jgi:hypothetical protein
MCLASKRNRCPVTPTRGHLGQPGAGGADRLVGRRRRSCGHGGGCLADAPLLSPSSRYFLVLIIYLKSRKLTIKHLKVRKFTCLDSRKNIFLKLSIILMSDNNCLFNLLLNNLDFCLSRII